jgi:spoIIIJ-associated protein
MTEQPAEAMAAARSSLEEEGEIAADYLEEFLDIVDMDGDIDIDVDHGRAVVAVVSEDKQDRELDRLVGPDGKVLDALQELTRIAVQNRCGERSRLMVDVAGFRAKRRQELVQLAASAIEEVRAKGFNLPLEPMNAFERKVIHDEVAAAGLFSQSSGAEPDRYVVIRPA